MPFEVFAGLARMGRLQKCNSIDSAVAVDRRPPVGVAKLAALNTYIEITATARAGKK